MEIKDIKPGQCYKLVTGRVIRVKSIEKGIAHGDMYHHTERKWINANIATPTPLFKEPCDEPNAANE